MNMRKIIAVLAAVLMLCTVIPMGAVSVAADGAFDFEDGTVGGWQSGCNIEVVDDNGNKVLKWDASGADWANVYFYGSAMVSANTDYVVSFRVKADRNTNINFKVNNNWAGDTAAKTFDVSTEWQEYSEVINSGDCTSGALLMFSSNTTKANGATYYLDDISFVEYVEPVEPGTVINGDFETGDLSGWASHQGTVISTDAHSGSYAANIKGDGGWGGMLNQDVPVEAGKTYKVSIWVKANANGANVQIKDGGTEGANLASQWHTATEWTELVWEVVPTTDVICFNFCGGGNGTAEDVLVDDITVTEKVFGQVINGDFSNGSEGWNLSGYASVVDGAVQLDNPTQYNEALSQIVDVEPNTNYEITWKSKRISGTGAFNLYVIQSVSPWGNLTRVAGQNWMNETSGEWVDNSYTVNSGDNAAMLLKFSTEGTDPGVILLDDVVVTKVVEASNDGFVKNGDFETGKAEPEWTVYSGTAVSADAAYTGSYGLYIKNPTGGWGGTAFQDFTVEVGKTYRVTMWAKNLDGARGQNIQIQNPIGSNVGSKWFDNTFSWTQQTFEFTATDTNVRINICGGGTGANEELYVDDIQVKELVDPSFDGYIYNGDFETGELHPWNNLWNSNTVNFVEGYEGSYAMEMIAPGQWNQVRQDGIAVEANTTYRLSAYVKNAQDMSFVIKTGDDSTDLTRSEDGAFPNSDDWQLFTMEFNTGVDKDGNAITIDSICILVISYGVNGGSVIIDNIVMEKVSSCEHEYEYNCSKVCSICGEESRPEADHAYFYECDQYCMECGEQTNPRATHSKIHVEAKEAVNCIEYGNKEYWYCEHCGAAWLDEAGRIQTNMMSVRVAGECVSDAEYACQDGVCVNCSLPYAADEAHTYDNDYDADCNVCGDVREVETPVVYGDANGDGSVDGIDAALLQQYVAGWEVSLETSADANGDGSIDGIDVALLQQYVAGWDVSLGA